MPDSRPHLRKILGLQERISRRDFLNGALLASDAALIAGTAPREILAQSEGGTVIRARVTTRGPPAIRKKWFKTRTRSVTEHTTRFSRGPLPLCRGP